MSEVPVLSYVGDEGSHISATVFPSEEQVSFHFRFLRKYSRMNCFFAAVVARHKLICRLISRQYTGKFPKLMYLGIQFSSELKLPSKRAWRDFYLLSYFEYMGDFSRAMQYASRYCANANLYGRAECT